MMEYAAVYHEDVLNICYKYYITCVCWKYGNVQIYILTFRICSIEASLVQVYE